MIRAFTAVTTAAFVLSGIAMGIVDARAQGRMLFCKSRVELVRTLAEKHSEHLVARFLDGDSALVEIYGSVQGTVTVLVVQPVRLNGSYVACIMSTGTALTVAPPGEPT